MKEKVLNNKKNGMLVLILTTLLYLLSIAVCVVGAMIGNPLLLGISIFWMCDIVRKIYRHIERRRILCGKSVLYKCKSGGGYTSKSKW